MSISEKSEGQPSASVMAGGIVEIQGQIPWSSNATFTAIVKSSSATNNKDAFTQVIYKPLKGEQHLWDFPPGLYRREVAAYELSRAIGWDIVPETIVRADAPFGIGSLQRLINADFAQHYFTLFEDARYHDMLRRIAVFDMLANNADRKSGHCLLDKAGKIWAIDHGLCLNAEPKLRTVIWEFAGETISNILIEQLADIAQTVPAEIEALIEPSECEALMQRAAAIIQSPVFPQAVARYSYPWPLV